MLKSSQRVVHPSRTLSSASLTIQRHYTVKYPPSPPNPKEASSSTQPYEYKKPQPPPQTWLAQYLRRSPRAMSAFKNVAGVLGMNNPRQVGGQITYHYYQAVCISREQEERKFWHDECRLPPTFQTWFTVTNLHIWLLTVRFRALPLPYGDNFVQGLVDHFFLDVEDRIRATLSKKAPERLVTRQMKIFREQWAGLGLALDYALGLSSPFTKSTTPDGDVEMAATVWRNFLGARGAQGVHDPGKIRHAVNITGEYGKEKLSKDAPEESLRKLEETDDGSGIHDFIGEETKLYVGYPELMYTLVKYIRKELVRLESVPDSQILNGEGVGTFGKIREI